MHFVRTLMAVALVVVASVAPAFAGDDEKKSDELTQQLMQRVQQLEKKLAELENAKDAAATPLAPASDDASAVATVTGPQLPEPPAAVAPAQPSYTESMGLLDDADVTYGTKSSFMTWHGYLNFEAFKQQGTNSNFDNHEFYLATKARISERVGFTAEFEYEHNPEKLILPIQAYADLKVADPLIFRAGLWYSPIGMPRGYTLRGNRNRMIRQVALTHDLLFENWSEMGVQALGEFRNGVFYQVGVGNGMPNTMATGDSWFDADGTLQNHTEDNNNNKALHSRVGYHTAQLGGGELNAAMSFGTQKYDPAATRRLTFRGLDLRYLHASGWRTQMEYMDRSGDDNPPDLAKGISADAKAWYVQVSKRWVVGSKWVHYLEPAIQVDSIDWNKHVVDSNDKLTTALALVYSPVENYLLKFEYDLVHERGRKVDNNKVWMAVVMEF